MWPLIRTISLKTILMRGHTPCLKGKLRCRLKIVIKYSLYIEAWISPRAKWQYSFYDRRIVIQFSIFIIWFIKSFDISSQMYFKLFFPFSNFFGLTELQMRVYLVIISNNLLLNMLWLLIKLPQHQGNLFSIKKYKKISWNFYRKELCQYRRFLRVHTCCVNSKDTDQTISVYWSTGSIISEYSFFLHVACLITRWNLFCETQRFWMLVQIVVCSL